MFICLLVLFSLRLLRVSSGKEHEVVVSTDQFGNFHFDSPLNTSSKIFLNGDIVHPKQIKTGWYFPSMPIQPENLDPVSFGENDDFRTTFNEYDYDSLEIKSVVATGYRTIVSDFFPMTPYLQDGTIGLRLQGEFKVLSGLSPVYVYIDCYANERQILSKDVRRSIETQRRVFDVSLDGSTMEIQDITDVEAWNLQGIYDCIGLYFDGNTEHLPDFVTPSYDKQAARSTKNGNIITLGQSLPSDIIDLLRSSLRTAVAVVHTSAGVFVYPFQFQPSIDEVEKSFDVIVKGTEWVSTQAFRPDTTKFRVGLILNYRSTNSTTALLNFKTQPTF